MKKIILIAISTIVVSCGGDIDLVKSGVFNSFPQTTVGDALDSWSECVSSSWENFETSNNSRYVNFYCSVDISSIAQNEKVEYEENPDRFYIICVQAMGFWSVPADTNGCGGEDQEIQEKIYTAERLAVESNPILQIQFILNLDDTFELNTISLLNPSEDIIVDSIFGFGDLMPAIYSDQSLSQRAKEAVFYGLAKSI